MRLRLDQVSGTGKKLRLGNIFRKDGNTVIVAMSHGLAGPIRGIQQPLPTIQKAIAGGPDAYMTNLATITRYAQEMSVLPAVIWNPGPFCQHLDPHTAFRCVEEATRLGVDGLEFPFGAAPDQREEYIKLFGPLGVACERYGMPLLAEPVPITPDGKPILDADVIKVFARLCAELGSDVVKVMYSGSPDSFSKVVDTCPAPVVIAGGPRTDNPHDVLEMVRGAMDAGASGVAMGRNIWQHENPTGMVGAVVRIVHEQATVAEAMESLR